MIAVRFSYFPCGLIGLSKGTYLTTTGLVYLASHPLLNDLFSEVRASSDATFSVALDLADNTARHTSIVSTSFIRAMVQQGRTLQRLRICSGHRCLLPVQNKDKQRESEKLVREKTFEIS